MNPEKKWDTRDHPRFAEVAASVRAHAVRNNLTSPLQAREQCVQAVEEAIRRSPRNGSDGWAEAAISVLLGTPDTRCPQCLGSGATKLIDESPGNPILRDSHRCPPCGSSGVVPGTAALRVPCERCEGDGEQPWAGDEMAMGMTTCTGCDGSGFGLAAIDVARGVKQVGWVNDVGSFGPPTVTNAEPVYRFPRRVTGEQT